MIPFTSISGLVVCGLVAIAAPLQLLNVGRFPVAVRLSVFAILAALTVIPVNGVMIAGYVWGLIGDPSVATIALMSLVCIKQLTGRDVCDDRNVWALLLVVLVGGSVLYPLALGLSPYDPYALGFGSWSLYALLLALAVAAWWLQLHLVVVWIMVSVLGYTFGLFESTNLWNYLLDPIAVVIAIGWTVVKVSERRRSESEHEEVQGMKPLQTQKINAVEIAAYAFVLIVSVIGLILAMVNRKWFQNQFIVEDGLIEWLTVVGFAAGGFVCFWRVWRLRRVRSIGFLALTGLLGCAFLFIAGEEVSWGQRIFDVETPQWMEERNTQQEMNLHNLKLGDVRINKLLFSQLAAVVMIIYFAVLMPFYGKAVVAKYVDALAIPIPKLHHTLACVLMLVVTQVLIPSSRRGELAEMGGAILFTIIVAFPSNFAAFDPRRKRPEAPEPSTIR